MSDDILARARAALELVHRAPWTQGKNHPSNVYHQGRLIAECCTRHPIGENNAHFIAAARSLVPEMADEIARLRAEVERLREAERTAWIAGRDAAVDAIDDELRRFKDWYSDSTAKEAADELVSVIRALTPEASHD
jgi:uncharacterized small protein (DUF1192 family)